jgi:hypothetical protein
MEMDESEREKCQLISQSLLLELQSKVQLCDIGDWFSDEFEALKV